jgi:hypothetical protein
VKAEIAVNQQVITHLASFVPFYDKLHDIIVDARRSILLRKCNLELNMTATEVTERGLGGGKDISVYSVYSVAESYKKQIWFSIT